MKKLLLALAFIAGAQASPVVYTSIGPWTAAVFPEPYGTENYDGLISGLNTSGSGVQGVSGGNLHAWLTGPMTVNFSLVSGELFSAFILKLDTAPFSAGSGVILSLGGAPIATVGTAGIYAGWLGFTTDTPVATVSLSTQSYLNGAPWEHLNVDEVRWTVPKTSEVAPEPGTWILLGLGFFILALVVRYRRRKGLPSPAVAPRS